MPTLSELMSPQVAQQLAVFQPYTTRRLQELVENETRFVHYTSAAVGIEILKTKTLWLRKVCCMDDFSEVDHGLACLHSAYKGEHGIRLRKVVDCKFPGLSTELEALFDKWQSELRYRTHVISLSEHAGQGHEDEDKFGRLSMWRAYGRGVGVALVVRQEAFWLANVALGLYTAPVAYLDEESFAEQLGILASNLEVNSAYLDQIGRQNTLYGLLYAFAAAAIATKHPGFKEEREWRVIRSSLLPDPLPLQRETRAIGGVPQEIVLFKLENNETRNINGISVPEVLDRVVIGPTEYPIPIYHSYVAALEEHGFKDPQQIVKMSLLPLRAASL